MRMNWTSWSIEEFRLKKPLRHELIFYLYFCEAMRKTSFSFLVHKGYQSADP